MKYVTTLFASILALTACSSLSRNVYPLAPRGDVVEDFHGISVPDPYRWLEDDGAPATKAFVEAQNNRTREFLDGLPDRPKLLRRLTRLWDYPKYSAPSKRGGRYFYSLNDGLQNQSVLYMQEGLEGDPRVALDPNTLSEDGTVALSGVYISRDGRRMAWGVSVHGSDRQEFKVRDLDSGTDLPETIQWCKFASIAWVEDGSGFFYNRFPEPGSVPPEDEANHSSVWWHALGTPQTDDTKVFDLPDQKELGFSPWVSEDGRFLFLSVWRGTDPNTGVYYAPLVPGKVPKPDDVVRFLEPDEAAFNVLESVGDRFILWTNLNAPRGKIISANPALGREAFRDLVPQADTDVIDQVELVGDRMVITWMTDAHARMTLHEMDGRLLSEVDLPGVGSVLSVSGRVGEPEAFFTFTSFLVPPTIYRLDTQTAEVSLFRSPELTFDPTAFETTQVFVTSKDGTRVPMFLTYAKGTKPTGDLPILLYGYGGFNINITPYFSLLGLLFVESGGVYGVVNLRGGSEYGEDWHQAGMLGRKQNVFDDFIAAAEWLVSNGWSRPARIGILGGSNGGLLVTACILQRPDLYGGAVAAVPVTDMLRYHRFTVGRYWIPEYGNAEESSQDFGFLSKYSPLHNIKEGVDYPPILVTTAETDDRVVPAHSRKFVAALQYADPGINPILLRVEMKAGHGAGKPTSMKIEETADMLAFLMSMLGMRAR